MLQRIECYRDMFLSQTQILTLQPLAALTKEFEKAKVRWPDYIQQNTVIIVQWNKIKFSCIQHLWTPIWSHHKILQGQITSSPFSSICFLSSVVQYRRDLWVLRRRTVDYSRLVVFFQSLKSVWKAFKTLQNGLQEMCLTFHANVKLQFVCMLRTLFPLNKTNTAFEVVSGRFDTKSFRYKSKSFRYTCKVISIHI